MVPWSAGTACCPSFFIDALPDICGKCPVDDDSCCAPAMLCPKCRSIWHVMGNDTAKATLLGSQFLVTQVLQLLLNVQLVGVAS